MATVVDLSETFGARAYLLQNVRIRGVAAAIIARLEHRGFYTARYPEAIAQEMINAQARRAIEAAPRVFTFNSPQGKSYRPQKHCDEWGHLPNNRLYFYGLLAFYVDTKCRELVEECTIDGVIQRILEEEIKALRREGKIKLSSGADYEHEELLLSTR